MIGKKIKIKYYEYMNLYNVLHELREKTKNKVTILSGTKQIPPELIVVAMLKDRYLFLYDARKCYQEYGMEKEFTMEVYQVAALAYVLEQSVESKELFTELIELLNVVIKPFTFEYVRSEFQQYYENEMMDNYGFSFTELRDEYSYLYDLLLKEWLQKSP